MSVHKDHELKREFQVERLALFSDAVFAIAITLLIIEVKIPHLTEPFTDHHLLEIMGDEMVAKFIGFIVSFLVIAVYWVSHHILFGYVTNYSKRLVWSNLYFLFTIVLMPFSSGFYSEYWMSDMVTPTAFYAINLALSGITLTALWRVIANPKNKLASILPSQPKVRYYRTRALAAPGVFLLSLLVAFISPKLSYFIPLGIPVVLGLVRAYYKRKWADIE